MDELIYTSAPEGLATGARGYCTVAQTRNTSRSLVGKLESLCNYKHVFAPGDPNEHLNPINFQFVRFRDAGKAKYVLSRIGNAGFDYTQRTNFLAHNIALDRASLPKAGPVWFMSQHASFATQWDENRQPEYLAERQIGGDAQISPAICEYWKAVTGDSGHGGWLAENLLDQKIPEVVVAYSLDSDILKLLEETFKLIPEASRWKCTFSTYSESANAAYDCKLRCVLVGSPAATKASQSTKIAFLDLSKPFELRASAFVDLARTGVQQSTSTIEAEPQKRVVEPVPELVDDVTFVDSAHKSKPEHSETTHSKETQRWREIEEEDDWQEVVTSSSVSPLKKLVIALAASIVVVAGIGVYLKTNNKAMTISRRPQVSDKPNDREVSESVPTERKESDFKETKNGDVKETTSKPDTKPSDRGELVKKLDVASSKIDKLMAKRETFVKEYPLEKQTELIASGNSGTEGKELVSDQLDNSLKKITPDIQRTIDSFMSHFSSVDEVLPYYQTPQKEVGTDRKHLIDKAFETFITSFPVGASLGKNMDENRPPISFFEQIIKDLGDKFPIEKFKNEVRGLLVEFDELKPKFKVEDFVETDNRDRAKTILKAYQLLQNECTDLENRVGLDDLKSISVRAELIEKMKTKSYFVPKVLYDQEKEYEQGPFYAGNFSGADPAKINNLPPTPPTLKSVGGGEFEIAERSWAKYKRPYFWCRFIPWKARWSRSVDWPKVNKSKVETPEHMEWFQTHQYFVGRLALKRGSETRELVGYDKANAEVKELSAPGVLYYGADFDLGVSGSKLSVRIPTFQLQLSAKLDEGFLVSIKLGAPEAIEAAQTEPLELVYSGHLGEKHSYTFPFKLSEDNAGLVNALYFKEIFNADRKIKEDPRLDLTKKTQFKIETSLIGNKQTTTVTWTPEKVYLPTETAGNRPVEVDAMRVELPTMNGQKVGFEVINYSGRLALKEEGATRGFDIGIEDYAQYAAHLFVTDPKLFKEFDNPTFVGTNNPFAKYVEDQYQRLDTVPAEMEKFNGDPQVRRQLREFIEPKLNLPRGEFMTGEMILRSGYLNAHKNYLGKVDALDNNFKLGPRDPIGFARKFINTNGGQLSGYDTKAFSKVKMEIDRVNKKFYEEQTIIKYKDKSGEFNKSWPTSDILNFPFENIYIQLKAINDGGKAEVNAAKAALLERYKIWLKNYRVALSKPCQMIFNEYWSSVKPKVKADYSLDKVKAINKEQMKTYAGDIFMRLQFLEKTQITYGKRTFKPIVNIKLPNDE